MKSIKLAVIAAALSLNFSCPPLAAHGCSQLDLIDFGAGVGGKATLCIEKGGPRATMHVSGLQPGEAYTVWWVYFDDPSQCEVPNECAEVDFAGDNPQAVLGRLGSTVAPRSGKSHFAESVSGLRPSAGSQIWLLMFGHGPADDDDGRHRARQLLTPEDPTIGIPHLGNTVDGALGFPVSVAVHVVE